MAMIYGSKRAEYLMGTYRDDTIYGYGGNDDIFGWAGDDRILGGFGADHIDGGDGNDTAVYSDSDVGVTVSLATGKGFDGTAEGDTLANVENLTGSPYDDTLIGDDGVNILDGGFGDDTIEGGGGDDILIGFYGHDTLRGGDGSDALMGDRGNDWLDGGTGDDRMSGGEGHDVYYVDSTFDVVIEDPAWDWGYDAVYSSAYAYYLSDFSSIEILSLNTAAGTGVYAYGNVQRNEIYGNANDNVVDGRGGSDTLYGGAGNDTFIFFAGEASGDIVADFSGNGAAAGDGLMFQGYGTLADGATLRQLSATEWEITSADRTLTDVITLVGAPAIDASDFQFV
jgi:Ca2+-binding RTX toxin-like protein